MRVQFAGGVFFRNDHQGRHQDAEVAFRKSTEIDPRQAATWNSLGVAHYEQGLHAKAENAYRRAIAIDPGFFGAWNNLGVVYRDLGDAALRAALRAAESGNLRIMFPMVATLGEVRTARRVLQQCATELRSEGHRIAADIEVGIMIETPAAAMIADQLAGEVDFFSIGTNDLSQYALAADRTNPATGELASAFQPSVLRLIAHVVVAAHARGKRVAVCGELGGEALAIPILIGLGVEELSMSAPAIPAAKQILRSLELADMREAAARALEAESPDDVQALVRQRFPTIV